MPPIAKVEFNAKSIWLFVTVVIMFLSVEVYLTVSPSLT
ncbi:hypothetical protein COI_2047 [Mannheimia haemolytica serotype A2 str. OVINE]|nr:hypothetical protein COI_2047 [Mannheimia haemolytica serotype A2 str. OVINE]EEY13383.1 hypothetical protein COK_0524 [Mannheimia haemolytica serotype A2 str. BOVINE]